MRGDIESANIANGAIEFQSTPLREGRHGARRLYVDGRHFNPRPSVRGDMALAISAAPREPFQSTPLREGRLVVKNAGVTAEAFQSTPPREGRQKDIETMQRIVKISIHAPP